MWTLTKDKNWESLLTYSWVADMQGVQQSKVHHAEGDVAIHTQMVLKALVSLEEYTLLPEQEMEIVWTAALMHDIEKRSTTFTDETGEVVSPGHAKKGALTTRQILYREIDTPFEIREQIVALVRYHGLPLWIFEKPNPVQALLKASLEVNFQLLVMLAKADVLGRICKDQQELLYRIEMFKELCIEQNCWDKPIQFPSMLAKFQYFRKEECAVDYIPFDTTKFEVVIVSGIAGSGKDRYINTHLADYAVISLDDMRRKQKVDYRDKTGNGQIIQAAKELAREYLRQQKPFVWNATNITAQMREQLIDLFTIYNPSIRLIYLEVSYKKLMSQNRNRPHPLPDIAVEKMINKLDVPKLWEAHKVEYIISL